MVVCAAQHLRQASAVLLPRVGRHEFIGPPTPAPLRGLVLSIVWAVLAFFFFFLKVWLKGMTLLDVTPSLWCSVGGKFFHSCHKSWTQKVCNFVIDSFFWFYKSKTGHTCLTLSIMSCCIADTQPSLIHIPVFLLLLCPFFICSGFRWLEVFTSADDNSFDLSNMVGCRWLLLSRQSKITGHGRAWLFVPILSKTYYNSKPWLLFLKHI